MTTAMPGCCGAHKNLHTNKMLCCPQIIKKKNFTIYPRIFIYINPDIGICISMCKLVMYVRALRDNNVNIYVKKNNTEAGSSNKAYLVRRVLQHIYIFEYMRAWKLRKETEQLKNVYRISANHRCGISKKVPFWVSRHFDSHLFIVNLVIRKLNDLGV